jgi:hypothetical protein
MFASDVSAETDTKLGPQIVETSQHRCCLRVFVSG